LQTPDKLDSLLASIDAIPEIGKIHFESGVRLHHCEEMIQTSPKTLSE
jgi:hypothetical protein